MYILPYPETKYTLLFQSEEERVFVYMKFL